MSRSLAAGILAMTLGACSGGSAKEVSETAATTPASGAAPAVPRRAERSLASGTRVDATIRESLSSRTNKAGETVHATVSGDVRDARGAVVIPSGSTVTLSIAQLEPGSDQVRPEGRLSLVVNSVTVDGQSYPVNASLAPVPHTMKGRGVTKDEAERVGAGTAIGAIAGQLIGKNTRSTVIGGAVGAVAGGAVAARYAYRDVVVAAGTPIVITLAQSLVVSPR